MKHDHTDPYCDDVVHTAENFTCTNGEVRLVGGASNNTGTVQVCLNQRFGTICDDFFDNYAAQVVCSGLGFQRSGKILTELCHV